MQRLGPRTHTHSIVGAAIAGKLCLKLLKPLAEYKPSSCEDIGDRTVYLQVVPGQSLNVANFGTLDVVFQVVHGEVLSYVVPSARRSIDPRR